MKKILAIAIVAALLIGIFKTGEVKLGAGVFAPEEPKQRLINDPVEFSHQEFTLKPLATFEITAKVISREDYAYDEGAKISPVDFALGWGRMSDESVLEHISFSQSGRWYRYSYEQAPIPQKEIETHSANMHMIPAESWIESDLHDVKPGQIIQIEGKLVEASRSDGWRWKSSLRRDDTGGGACELVYVESIKIIQDG